MPPPVELIESEPPLSDSKKNAAKTNQRELLRANQRLGVHSTLNQQSLLYRPDFFIQRSKIFPRTDQLASLLRDHSLGHFC
jgi:hypothetical protein